MAGRFMANSIAMLRNLVNNYVYIYTDAGAPTNGTSGTLATFAGAGSLYIDCTASVGIVYVNQGTKASPTWVAIGTTLPGSITLATGSILVGTAGVAAALDAKTSGRILVGNGTTVVSVAVSGDVTLSSAGAVAIGAGKITDAMMGANVLTSASISANLIQRATGTISAADIISTSAGKFGHAQGYIMVAAPAAGFSLSVNKVLMHYTFGVAAYTAGGNITVNFGAGGAALTGLISAANSVGAASSKSIAFYPLTTVGVAMVSAAALNLVSSVAFTNPGTATGTITYEVYYTVNNPGF